MAECKEEPYRTIRYMKASIIKNYIKTKEYEFNLDIASKIEQISENSIVGVRLKINSPIFIEKIIEIGKDDLSELTIDIEPLNK